VQQLDFRAAWLNKRTELHGWNSFADASNTVRPANDTVGGTSHAVRARRIRDRRR